jgi:hypothetical protein
MQLEAKRQFRVSEPKLIGVLERAKAATEPACTGIWRY